MAYSRQYRSNGFIPQASGAGVAALRQLAVQWELQFTETADCLTISVWGCEIRVTGEPGQLQIALSGPEERLIGHLQDTTTEVLAEAGLVVQWDKLSVGALAPGLSLMRLQAVRQISPGFIRARIQGPDAARFGTGSLHFRLLLPPPGRAPVWPRVAATGRTVWPEGEDALHRPVYTVAAQAENWIDFDIYRHDNSPTCDWATSAPAGQEIAILGPGGGWCPQAAQLWLYGDETAQPAIARMLDLAAGTVQAWLTSAPADLGGLSDDSRVHQSADLLESLAANDAIQSGDFVWFAAASDQARAARLHLQNRGLARKDFTAAAYWDRGPAHSD